MKLFGGVLTPALILVLLPFCSVRAENEHQFIGAQKCRVCHMSKNRGRQHGIWKESRHAKAYETLATEESIKIAKEKGLKKPPQEEPECLKCHLSGWDAPKEMLGTKYDKAEGVSCEGCHGPGGDYYKMSVMKDKEEAIRKGLIVTKEEDCLACHNKESPTYKPFDYKTFWAKIVHDKPLTE